MKSKEIPDSVVRQLDAWLEDSTNWDGADIDNESGTATMGFEFKSEDGRYVINGSAQSAWYYLSGDFDHEFGTHHGVGEWVLDEVVWYEIDTVQYNGKEIKI